MPSEATSQNLRGATELTLIADIKPGFVPTSETLTYGRRLRRTLSLLLQLRKRALEIDMIDRVDALQRLRVLRFFHWALIDDERRLMLAVSFDGPWEPYIRGIADSAGPLIDMIFCHCEGYQGHGTRDGFRKFESWIRPRQINCDLIYAHEPDLTTDDVRYLKAFEQTYAGMADPKKFPCAAAEMTIGVPASPLAPDAEKYFELLGALALLRPMYALDPGDHDTFDRMARALSRDLQPTQAAAGAGPQQLQPPAELVAWSQQLATLDPRPIPGPVEVDLGDKLATVQGNVLTGYSEMSVGCLVFVQFSSASGGVAFLDRIKPTTHSDTVSDNGYATNLALTLHGLQTLGCSAQLVGAFPKEFRDGLSARASLLGIVDSSHPTKWTPPRRNWPFDVAADPVPLETVDAVVILERTWSLKPDGDEHVWKPGHPLEGAVRALGDQRPGEIRILAVEPLRRASSDKPNPYVREHFGFLDGISQPAPMFKGRPANARPEDQVPLGEILLGHPNSRGETPTVEGGESLVENGSFLVMTKLSQDVASFRAYVESQGDGDQDGFAARLLGRGQNGTPLIAGATSNNAFDFAADGKGAQCPFHAHIRRANPRSTGDGSRPPTPRIMRRGFAYGPDRKAEGAKEERGIVFMAYNASIADQYEVIQRWVNGGNSTGILSAVSDMIAGLTPPPPKGDRYVRVPAARGEPATFQAPREPFVRMVWGLYLFVPSTEGIKDLVKSYAGGGLPSLMLRQGATPPAAASPVVAAGQAIIQRLLALPADQAPDAWKRLLEERELVVDAAAVWAAIVAGGGVLKTPYAILVGDPQGVTTVLSDESRFSVREYWQRMSATFGETYLGMDRAPTRRAARKSDQRNQTYESKVNPGRYDSEAKLPNQYIYSIGLADAFIAARQITLDLLAAAPRLPSASAVPLDGYLLAFQVLGALVKQWFGMPDPQVMTVDQSPAPDPRDPRAHCPVDFLLASEMIFGPNPGPATRQLGIGRGQVLRKAGQDFVADSASKGTPFLKYLGENGYCKGDPDALARAWTGVISGFVTPTFETFTTVLGQWIGSKELWRLQQALQGSKLLGRDTVSDRDLETSPLMLALKTTMPLAPVPDLLHREVVNDTAIDDLGSTGNPEMVAAGTRMVIGLGAVARADPSAWEILFGRNDAAPEKPIHGCPGYRMALGVMLGLTAGIVAQTNLQDDQPTLLRLKYGG